MCVRANLFGLGVGDDIKSSTLEFEKCLSIFIFLDLETKYICIDI